MQVSLVNILILVIWWGRRYQAKRQAEQQALQKRLQSNDSQAAALKREGSTMYALCPPPSHPVTRSPRLKLQFAYNFEGGL